MALATQKQVEELADSLSACADSAHERLMKAIKDEEISHEEAQAAFQDETTLRQRANSLYIDAVKCVVNGLEETQKSLIAVIDTANSKLRRIKKISDFIDLVADLLTLAAAAYAAKPGPIIAALKEVKKDINALGEG